MRKRIGAPEKVASDAPRGLAPTTAPADRPESSTGLHRAPARGIAEALPDAVAARSGVHRPGKHKEGS
ncbi:hypothetical protein [Peterkaempfera bronchialis]|uniref:Uncharacterized protein n=1 Tax=Peterkaempfera bronchialis TaxID=2126346 RepID=A0A345SSD6_9ACTN|nr:hypothetical protein [Peterkaempfera bronchialis]AXI76641.1 hypothetical protein C7M71_003320 [Peterkaempfera bronchialis]